MLKSGPVVCAEGYLFECERRGYLQAGAFVPKVVLDHPAVVAELHREFVHAGSDVVEAFTYYGRSEERRVGKECRSRRSPFQLKRWVDPSKLGWWSGDRPTLAADGARYVTRPAGV